MDFSKYKLNVVPVKDDTTSIYSHVISDARRKSFPVEYNRVSNIPPVMDQGSIGSCIGASGYITMHDVGLIKNDYPSALWIYHNAKRYDSFIGEKYSGTTIIGAFTGLVASGCCSNTQIPYVQTEVFEFTTESIEWASKNKLFSYYKIDINDIDGMKYNIYSKNKSLWLAFNISQQFFDIKEDGILYEEGYDMTNFKGGHAVAVIGWKYIDNKLFWMCRNSYGIYFGNGGDFYIEHSLLSKVIFNGGSYVGALTSSDMPVIDTIPAPVNNLEVPSKSDGIIRKIVAFIKKLFKR